MGLVFESAEGQGRKATPSSVSEVVGENAVGEGGISAALPGLSEPETLSVLPVEQQRETVLKWVARPACLRTCGEELAMLRALKALDYEQTLALLEAVSSASGGKGDSLDFVRVNLQERLAALDSKLALELGRQKNDAQLRSAALVAMVTKNAAEGFRALMQLPEAERSGAWTLAKAIDKPGGTLADLAAFIRESPQWAKDPSVTLGMEGWIAPLLARKMAADPEGGLAEMRQIAADFRAAKAAADPGAQQGASKEQQPLHLTLGMMTDLRELSPEAARKVFDSLNETEKNPFLISMEAAARLKELGPDAAIRFAETQIADASVKDAARGVWRGLSQQDRPSALQWIESLPPGAFRQGVMEAVRMEAAMRNRSFGSASGYLQEGAELLSRESQLDYYAAVVSKNKGASMAAIAPSEWISSLPIPEADKQELRRRVAPLKPK